jgi:hypothetical protein
MKDLKKYYCKICKKELIPRDANQTLMDENQCEVSLHHIDYQKNIAIRVCKDCHNKLHTSMKKHKYGYNNIIRRDGTKKGRLPHGEYPRKIIE